MEVLIQEWFSEIHALEVLTLEDACIKSHDKDDLGHLETSQGVSHHSFISKLKLILLHALLKSLLCLILVGLHSVFHLINKIFKQVYDDDLLPQLQY